MPIALQQQSFDACSQVADVLSAWGSSKILLIADRTAYELSGAKAVLATDFRRRRVRVFDAFRENPRLEDVCHGAEVFRQTVPDAVVAIGGGSAIDMAKLIRCVAAQSCSPHDILQDAAMIQGQLCPMIAVPTTAGTGSEATHFAVVYRQGTKHSVAHRSILPEVAIMDWQLTRSMPPRVTAETGLDALSQAIESLWSIHSTEQSIGWARESLELAVTHLAEAVHEGTPRSREAMCRAAHLAGRAINVTKTTAPHAVSYTMTQDFGVPHGHAAALTLGSFLEFNAAVTEHDVVDRRGVPHVQQIIGLILAKLGSQTPGEGRAKIAELMTSVGCETRLSDLGMHGHLERQRLADSVNVQRLQNNPRRVDRTQLLQLLETVQ